MLGPIRGFTSLQRTPQADLKLGSVLAFVAGAANAGGFLAVGQYTSHMTGMLSSVADRLVLGQLLLALGGVGALVAFLSGAVSTAWLVNCGQLLYLNRSHAHSPVLADRGRLTVHTQLVGAFLLGGLLGATGFKYLGYISTVPLATLLLLLVMRPVLEDWQRAQDRGARRENP